MTIGVGRNLDGPSCCAGNQLRARSNRTAPCSVRRPRVHCSWTNTPSHAGARVVHPRRNRFGQLIRHAVVEPVRQVLVVRHPRAVVGHQRVLIADLQAVRAGDVRDRPLPQVGAGVGGAEILRAIDQSRNVAVGRAAVRTLFDDANQIARRIGRRARSCRRRNTCRRNPRRRAVGSTRATTTSPASHGAGGPRTPTASGDRRVRLRQPGRRARAGSAERLRIPEDADLVARGHLPRDAPAGVLEGPVRVLSPARCPARTATAAGSPAFRL